MDTIGLSIEDMTSLMVSLKEELLKQQEETIRANTAQFISEGCSEDEAQFRAGTIGTQAVDIATTAGIIVANNRRILLDLKKVGLLPP